MKFVLVQIQKLLHQGRGEEEKMGWCKRNFFKTLGCIEKFFGREGGIYKIFQNWGGCKTLFYHLMIFFLNKNTNFCWKIAKIFKS